MMCSNSYLNQHIKVGQLSKCVINSIEMAGQLLAKRAVSSAKICNQQEHLIGFLLPEYCRSANCPTHYMIRSSRIAVIYHILKKYPDNGYFNCHVEVHHLGTSLFSIIFQAVYVPYHHGSQ